MKLDLSQFLKFGLPAMRVLAGRLTPGSMEAFLADVLLGQLEQYVTPAGQASYMAVGESSVVLPPDIAWTEEGIERWAASHVDAIDQDDEDDGE